MDYPPHAEPLDDLTLREAAVLYDVTVKTLSRHLRCGQLVGYKFRGETGPEWRVTRDALETAGYRMRSGHTDVATSESMELTRLREELAAVKRAGSADRRRANDLDRRLGHALLECGRLRTALAAATGEPEPAEQVLDAGMAKWLISAITGGAMMQKDAQPAEL